jgi:hypothetical protein
MTDPWAPWRPNCTEYFSNFNGGRYDQSGQHWFILEESAISTELNRGDLVIGSAGCDGISFCFRQGMPGIWAYYPIEAEHILVAHDMYELEKGWLGGSIKV